MTTAHLLLASVVVMTGALIQGSIGFGANLVAGPLLLLIDRSLVPVPLLVVTFFMAAGMWWRERHATERRGLRWGTIGRLPGAALGAVAVAVLPANALDVALGLVILAAVAVSTTELRIAVTSRTLLVMGALSGFFTSTAAVGGPPAALLFQRMPGPVVRSTVAALTAVGVVISCSFLALFGEFAVRDALAGTMLLPGLMAGMGASRWLARFVDAGRTRPSILALCGLSGAAVLVRGLA